MPPRPSADRTARLLLWNQKERFRFPADPRREFPLLDAETVLKLALGRHIEFSDPALKRVSAATLRAAATAHVRHFHFRADATLYEVLGVTPDATEQEIKDAFRLLMQLIHPDRQGARRDWPDSFAARANHAHTLLRDADARAKFDRQETDRVARSGLAQGAAAVPASPQAAPWPRPGRVTRRRPSRAAMPEWWTAGVGGFARAHPAVLAFGMLIGIAMLVIGFASWERDAGRLAREAREQAPSSLPASVGAPADRSVSAPEPSSNAPFSADAPRTKVNAETSAPATALRMARRDDPPAAMAPTTGPVALEVPPLPAAAIAAPVMPDAPAPRSVGAPSPPLPLATVRVPTADEIEAQFVVFVDTYNGGRLDALSALFDDDAQTNQRQGRAAIRREYDDLFQRSDWRRMKISRMSWKLAGEVAQVRAEGAVRIAWRDGREVEERFALDMDLAWRGGRVFIIRLAQRTSAP